MGVVMMTGIMAIAEMGLSLSSQSLIPKPMDAYSQSSTYSKRDKQMLRLINEEEHLDAIGRSWDKTDLCKQLRCRFTASGASGCVGDNSLAVNAGIHFSELQALRIEGVPLPKKNFSDACSLLAGNHRLLVRPSPILQVNNTSYQLFSCVLKDFSEYCEFETDKESMP